MSKLLGRIGGQRQAGYMLEVPLLISAVAIAAVILIPMLPPIGAKIFVGLATIVVIPALYYIIVTPGWQPGQSGPASRSGAYLAFGLIAAGIICSAALFVLNY